MEPFSITCHSCAARLKVANAELIEQTLACPKCGSMIHVLHPTGWKPPIPESKGSLSALSSVVSGNDFDQIDDLLPGAGDPARQAKTASVPANPKSQAKPKSTKARFQQPIPPTDAVVHPNGSPTSDGDLKLKDQPIMPGQQWASPSAQKRKKLMLMIGSAIGTVLVVALAIVAIVRFGNETPTDAPDQIVLADTGDNPDAPTADANQTPPLDETPTEPVAPTDPPDEFLDNAPTVGQLPIEQKHGAAIPPPLLPDSSATGFAAPDLEVANSTPDTVAPAVVEQNDPPVADTSNKAPAKIRSLPEVLDAAGISVSELKDTALLLQSYEESRNPEFPLEKPKAKNLNFQRLMSLPIRKLETPAGISLARAARTLNVLSGVPIAVDARQLSFMGLPANPTLQLDLKDETTLSAAEKIAELAGAKATVVGDGIFISLPADEKNADFKIAFPNVGQLTDQQKQRFLKSIQALIAPDVWIHPTAPATIGYEGETILLHASVGVHRHLQMLVDRLTASAELAADPANANAAVTVTSRWAASERLRSEPSGWSVGPDLTLASFLDRIERLHGLTVIIDWPPALDAGWTPLTMVPGELVETEVGEAIHQLAKSLDLKMVGIDAKTLQLTSSRAANGMQDLEVYPLLADWAVEIVPEEIEQLIFNTLGQQVQSSFVRVVYEPKCRCLIVVASQPIQHQVAKLVERLNRVDAAAIENR